MKVLTFLIAAVGCMSFTGWETNFDAAKQQAAKEHKLILLNFSGSDWCGPCIRLRKEIFESTAFKQVADSALVLVNADFPRAKKNQLTKELQQANDTLAEKYNEKGAFPFTLLLDADGKVLRSWDGYPKEGMDEFIAEVALLTHATH